MLESWGQLSTPKDKNQNVQNSRNTNNSFNRKKLFLGMLRKNSKTKKEAGGNYFCSKKKLSGWLLIKRQNLIT